MPLVNVNLDLSHDAICMLEDLKEEYGVSTRSKVLEILIEELINPIDSEN